MKIIHKVTLQHMKQNKKKTMVTLLGIVLSVALMTAISSYAASFLDLMRQRAIQNNGNWHVALKTSQKEAVSLASEDRVQEAAYAVNLFNGRLQDSKNENKPYLMIKAMDSAAMEMLLGEDRLLAGRYPQNDQEILIPEHLASNGGISWKLGDEITMEFGSRIGIAPDGEEEPLEAEDPYYGLNNEEGMEYKERLTDTKERTYRVVGIVKRPPFESRYQAGYSAVTILTPEIMAESSDVELYMLVKKVTPGIYDWLEGELTEKAIDHTVSSNDSLISTYMSSRRDTVNDMLDKLKWIMILIVMGGSISVIYSSFSISVAERSKYLGMLSSIGATKRQKMSSVYYEAFLLGIAGIPLGIFLGLMGTLCTMQIANPLLQKMNMVENLRLRLVISPQALGGAVVAAAITIFLSAWIPARRASRVSPIDAIRQTQDIKLTRRQVKTSRLTKTLFGFEGELALKNLKRSRGRYRATILSLAISIALFLGISGFTNYLASAYTMDFQYMDQSDICIYMYEEFPESEEFLKRLTEGMEITGQEWQMNWALNGRIEGASLSPGLFPYMGEQEDPLYIQMVALDEESLKSYAKKTGADYDSLADASHPSAILYDSVYGYQNDVKTSYPTLEGVKKGQDVTVKEDESNFSEITEDGIQPMNQGITVAAVTGERPLGGDANTYIGHITFYMSENTFQGILDRVNASGIVSTKALYLTAKHPEQLLNRFQELEKEWNSQKSYQIMYSSNMEIKQEGESTLMFMNLFVYGFIILTSLICTTSIFNTISTSMALRRREYAMLQSVGMDGKKFHRMIRFESLFYGLKALLYGLPLGILLTVWIYRVIATAFDEGYQLLWKQIGIAVISVFIIVGLTMRYSMKKIEKENIVDTLKEDMV